MKIYYTNINIKIVADDDEKAIRIANSMADYLDAAQDNRAKIISLIETNGIVDREVELKKL